MWTSEKSANMLWLPSQQIGRRQKEGCLQKSRTEQFNSSVGWRRKQSLYIQYRYRFVSKNSLWLIMSWERKDCPSPNIQTVTKFLPGWGLKSSSLLIRRVTSNSNKDKSSSVSPVANPCFVPASMSDSSAPNPDKLKVCPWTNLSFLTSCYIKTSSR